MKRYNKNGDIITKTYDELDNRDKKYVIKKLLNNDEYMAELEESEEEKAEDASKADRIYYAEMLSEKSDMTADLSVIDYKVSQVGVRPTKKWNLSELFECIPFTDSTNNVYQIIIDGNPYHVSYELSYVEIDSYSGDYIRCNLDELKETGVPDETIKRRVFR